MPVASWFLLHSTLRDTYNSPAPSPLPPPRPPVVFSHSLQHTHVSSRDKEKNERKMLKCARVWGSDGCVPWGSSRKEPPPTRRAAGGRPRSSFFESVWMGEGRGLNTGSRGRSWGWVGVGGVAGTAGGGSSVWFLPSASLQTRYSSPVVFFSCLRRGMRVVGWGVVEVVLLALSLERARQFVKAFGERGGNLHVT